MTPSAEKIEAVPTEEDSRLKVAVLVSGSGTNLQALMDRMNDGFLKARIVCVGSDRTDAYGLVRAEKAGIPTFVVDYARIVAGEAPEDVDEHLLSRVDARQKIFPFLDSDARRERIRRLIIAERALIEHLDRYDPDLICLAGFMRLLTPYFLDYYNREGVFRVVNIHPALLPAFPGQHGYEDTYAYGCRWGGVTVHFVDEGEDSGPVIAQAVYPVWDEDTVESIRKRGLHLEYKVYAQVINWIAEGRVKVEIREGLRPRVLIDDPDYREIIGSWVESAFRFSAS